MKYTLGNKTLELEIKSVKEILQSFSISLAKEAIAGLVNGTIRDFSYLVDTDAVIEPITLESKEAFHLLNHSGAHLMASAILNLFPETKFAIGPAIEEGFYYDMDLGRNITDEDLKAIEKEMNKVISANPTFIRENISKEKALEVFKDNKFKTEIINELEDGTITLYHLGKFTDLCSGPHVESAVKLRNFKLLSFSSAYWRGDQKRETLQRIYGVIQSSKEKLEEHLKMLEDAKNRDHRKLGKEMDIFFTHPLIGAGLPLWLPAGATLKRLLERYIQDKEIALGYDHVYTPVLATTSLYKTSGHWDHYKDNMFPIMKMDNEELVLRPMNCPHHMLVYKNSLHSYKDLPIKIGELAHDFRYEASGALLGIERVRAMCQNDAHLFVRADQIEEEFSNVVKLILDVYKDMNITKYSFRLSLRDPKDTEKYFPDDNMWNKAEDKLRQVLNDLKIPYEEAIGEAAFYGPKLDVQIRTALNHELTLSTCQLDFLLPERFDLTYIDPKGEKARPVVLHRAILGTTERFTAYLLEETKGVLPTWLSPLQVVVLPVNNEYHLEYAKLVNGLLKDNNIRAKVDFRDEKLGYKIREHQMAKVPFTLVIGDKELNEKSVTYRVRGSREEINVPIKNFIKLLEEEIKSKR